MEYIIDLKFIICVKIYTLTVIVPYKRCPSRSFGLRVLAIIQQNVQIAGDSLIA